MNDERWNSPDSSYRAAVTEKTSPVENRSRLVSFPTDRNPAPISGMRGAMSRWFAEFKIPLHPDPDRALTHHDYYRLLRSCPAYDRARKRALPKLAGNIYDFQVSEESHENFGKLYKKIFSKIKNFHQSRKRLAECLFEGRAWLKIRWDFAGIKVGNKVIRLKVPVELVPTMKENFEMQSRQVEGGNDYEWFWTEGNLATGRREELTDADLFDYITVANDAELRNKFQGDALQSYGIGLIKAIAYVTNYALVHAEKKAEIVVAIKSQFASMIFTELQTAMASGDDASLGRVENLIRWYSKQKQGGTVLLGQEDEAQVLDVAGQGQNIYISLLEYLNKQLETWILATLGGMDEDGGSLAKASVGREEQNDHLAWYQQTLVIEPMQELVKRVFYYQEYQRNDDGSYIYDYSGKPKVAWSNWQIFNQLGFTNYELPQFMLGEVGKDEPADLIPIYQAMFQIGAPVDTEEFYESLGRKRPEGTPDVLTAPQPPPGGMQPQGGGMPPPDMQGVGGEAQGQVAFAEQKIKPDNKDERKVQGLLKKSKKLLNELMFYKVTSEKESSVVDSKIALLISQIQYLAGLTGLEKGVKELQGKKSEVAEFAEGKDDRNKPLGSYYNEKIRKRLKEELGLSKELGNLRFYGDFEEELNSFNQQFNEAIDYLMTSTPMLGDAEYLRQYYFEGTDYTTPIFGAAQADTIDQLTRLQDVLTTQLQTGKGENVVKDIQGILKSTASYAENVYRTNTATAYSVGKQVKYKSLEDSGFILGYEFITAGDNRVRPRHAANDGAIISVDNPDLKGMFPPLGYQCYDKKTEVLTDKGWRLFSELKGNEKFFSLEPETKNVEWVKAVNYICQTSKKMFKFKGKSIDLCVTPGHKMLISTDWNHKHNDSKLEFRDADKVSSSNSIYRSSEWEGKDPEYVKIGETKINPAVFCKFMAYYLSEGSVSKSKTKTGKEHYVIKIAQKDPTKIYEDIKELPYKLWKGKEAIYIRPEEQLVKYLAKFGKGYRKYIPKTIKNMSKKLIEVFLDAYNYGDGSKVTQTKMLEGREITSTVTSYFTSSNKMAADLGELIVKSGKGVHYSKMMIKGTKQKFKNGTYRINHNVWRLIENKTTWQKFSSHIEVIENYNDFVYCVELEKYHTLFVRRNGRTAWCGNCRCILRPITRVEAKLEGMLTKDGKLKEWFPVTYQANIADPGFGRKTI